MQMGRSVLDMLPYTAIYQKDILLIQFAWVEFVVLL
jgi:hypothetical protein